MFPSLFSRLSPLFGLVLAVSVHAESTTFSDDFSTLANSDAATTAGLSRDSGELNGWNGRGLETWKVEDSAEHHKKVLRSLTGLASWHPLGRPHDVNLHQAKAVIVSMTVLQQKSHSSMWVWLADENQNGYGVEYTGVNQQVRIFKLRNNQQEFGQSRDVSSWSPEFGKDPSGKDSRVADPIEDGALVTIRLAIEQAKPGGPVTLTAWNVIEQGGVSGSFEDPLVKVEDSGDGSVFAGPKADFGPVFDLGRLTFAAFTASNNKDGQPAFSKVEVEVAGGNTASNGSARPGKK